MKCQGIYRFEREKGGRKSLKTRDEEKRKKEYEEKGKGRAKSGMERWKY